MKKIYLFFDRYPPTSFWQLLQFSLSFYSVALQGVFSVKLFFSCCAWYLVHFQGTRTFWKKKTKKPEGFFSSYFAPAFPLCCSSELPTGHMLEHFDLSSISLTLLGFYRLVILCCVLVNFSEGADPALSYIHEFSHWLVVVFYL